MGESVGMPLPNTADGVPGVEEVCAAATTAKMRGKDSMACEMVDQYISASVNR